MVVRGHDSDQPETGMTRFTASYSSGERRRRKSGSSCFS